MEPGLHSTDGEEAVVLAYAVAEEEVEGNSLLEQSAWSSQQFNNRARVQPLPTLHLLEMGGPLHD